jgi:protease I
MKGKRGDAFLSGGVVLLLAVCIAAAVVGCRKEKGEEPEAGGLPSIAGKTVVMVIASENFRDEELFEPKKIVEKAGGKVVVASSSLETAKGMLGKTAKPDVLLESVKAEDLDALVFIGGSGASEYWNDATAHALAKAAAEKGKLVSAICIAPVTLANAGLLEGKKATVWSGEAAKIKAKGATYTGAGVEIDGDIITANGPKSAAAFGRAIVRALGR